jgi:hypothetical protein
VSCRHSYLSFSRRRSARCLLDPEDWRVVYRAIIVVAASVILSVCARPNAPSPTDGSPSVEEGPRTLQPTRTEEQVRKDLASEGYGEIRELRSKPDGDWTAIAVLDGRERQVLITPNGFIFPR